MGKRCARTYKSPVDPTYGTKGADSGDGESELVWLGGDMVMVVLGRRE